ncbi:MAG: tetratricopeptide repeat protein [Desulfomonilaceae bacterium]|nr:tetratricopeptide repeat protein [Desulfomonilaceae bacterium]
MDEKSPTADTSSGFTKEDASGVRIAAPLELMCGFALFTALALFLHHKGFSSPFIYDSTFLSDNIRSFARHDLSEVIRIVPERSFTFLTFYANYLISGMDPYYFRLANVLVMAAAGLVLVLMFQVIFSIPGLLVPGSQWEKMSVAWFLGFVFVIHPIQSLVVLYVWQRMAIMACFFYFSSVTVYLAARSGRFPRKGLSYVLVSVLVTAGLLCKENVLTVPAVLLAAEATLFRQSFTSLVKKAALLALLALPALLTYLLVTHTLHEPTSLVPKGVLNRLNQHYLMSSLSPVQVLMTESRVFFSYLLTILAPFADNVQLIRAETISRSLWTPPTTIFACTGLIGLLFLGVMTARRARLMSFGILFTLVAMIPELILSPEYLFFGYRAILPMAGVLLLVGQAILIVISKSQAKIPRSILVRALASSALLFAVSLGLVTWSQAARWNPLNFWQESYLKLPPFSPDTQERSYVHILSNYGGELMKARRYPEAIALFEKALAIQPESHEIHGNLGSASLGQGRAGQAVKYFQKAIELKPDSAKAQMELGNAYLKLGKTSEAVTHYERARGLTPRSAVPLVGLANVLHLVGKPEEAVAAYRRAIDLDPASADAHTRLGNILLGRGKVHDALSHYESAVKASPHSAIAYNNVGAALLRLSRISEAKDSFQKALALQPGFAQAYANLGIVSLALGQPDKAIGYLRKSLERDGRLVLAYVHLGHAYRATGETRQAAEQYAKAVEIAPHLVEAHYGLANAMAELGRVDSASEHYNTVLRLDQRHYMAHNALGAVYAMTGKLPEAVHHFRRALKINPSFGDARKNLEEALRRRGNGKGSR